MCMLDGADPWQVYGENERKAAKGYRCCECNREIQRGEVYVNWRGLLDGYWSKGRCCLHCKRAAGWLMVVCHGYLWTAIEEDLWSHVGGDEDYLRSVPLIRLYRWMDKDWRNPDGELRPIESVEALTDKAIAAYQRKHDEAVAA